ncbi:MAG: hypothetical protein IPO06_17925 [Leptospiraceae bacterium]|nr:hypothetical protein [Leptospiraceae bacterium]
MFKKLGYGFKASDVKNTAADSLYCNYWIGNTAFWEKYIAFTKPIHDYILENKNDQEIVDKLKSNAPYHYPVSYIPFLMERLFSTLLWKDSSIKYLAYQYSPLEIANLINELRGYEYSYKKINVWYNLFHENKLIRFLKYIRKILLKITVRIK